MLWVRPSPNGKPPWKEEIAEGDFKTLDSSYSFERTRQGEYPTRCSHIPSREGFRGSGVAFKAEKDFSGGHGQSVTGSIRPASPLLSPGTTSPQ